MKATSSRLLHELLGTPLALVFKIQNGPGYLIMVCRHASSGTGVAYFGTTQELRLIEGVELKFSREGRTIFVEVHQDGFVKLDFEIGVDRHSHQYDWRLNKQHILMRLLPPRRYTLDLSDTVAAVREK